MDFTLKRSPRILGSLFLAEILGKVSFDLYNFGSLTLRSEATFSRYEMACEK